MSNGVDAGTVVMTAVVCVALGAIVILYLQRRSSLRVALLIEWLADLGAHRNGPQGESSTEDLQPSPEAGPGAPAKRPRSPHDPLAGKSSYAERIIDGVTDPQSLADEAIMCISRHLRETFAPAQLADELSVSLRSLQRGLAVSLGCTPGQLILAMKMREACRLLLNGHDRINEVARELDFSSADYFTRRFKAFYGVTPKKLAMRHPHRDATGGRFSS
jgi:AraC-like DNA-binding protein